MVLGAFPLSVALQWTVTVVMFLVAAVILFGLDRW